MIGCLVLPYFYAEAETQRRPELAGRPIIIHARGRVKAVSADAETAGLSVDMQLGRAYAICPEAESLPWDDDLYRAAQRRALDACAAYVSTIEPLSMNEVFLDFAGVGEPSGIIAEIAETVEAQARFTCRAGAGSSKLVARIAALEADSENAGQVYPSTALRVSPGPRLPLRPERSGKNGGAGQPRPTIRQRVILSEAASGSKQRNEESCHRENVLAGKLRPLVFAVPKGREARFLAPLPLSRLWLLDENTIEHLQALGMTTIGLLQQAPPGQLIERFGRLGLRLSELAVGIDRSPVRSCYPPSTIDAHLSFSESAEDMTVVEAGLRRLARKVAEQLRNCGQGAALPRCGAQLRGARSCCRLGLEVESDDGASASYWLRASIAMAAEDEILRAAARLLGRALGLDVGRAQLKAPIAALTLHAAELQHCAGAQLDLLGDREREEQQRRRERLTEVVASAQKRFGARTVRWARELETPRRERMLACLMAERR
jgi:nucleotidyltransferase/DNA polymerase involved in DNA repair